MPLPKQLCCLCEAPTGRCNEDSIYLEPEYEHQGSLGPLCEDCADEILNKAANKSIRPAFLYPVVRGETYKDIQ